MFDDTYKTILEDFDVPAKTTTKYGDELRMLASKMDELTQTRGRFTDKTLRDIVIVGMEVKNLGHQIAQGAKNADREWRD